MTDHRYVRTTTLWDNLQDPNFHPNASIEVPDEDCKCIVLLCQRYDGVGKLYAFVLVPKLGVVGWTMAPLRPL